LYTILLLHEFIFLRNQLSCKSIKNLFAGCWCERGERGESAGVQGKHLALPASRAAAAVVFTKASRQDDNTMEAEVTR
jgi:hypothetical protein